jgi:hypothetical protein
MGSGYTDLLYARPSFLEGAVRLFDFAGALNVYNESLTGDEADFRALRADWYAVGQDVYEVLQRMPRPPEKVQK